MLHLKFQKYAAMTAINLQNQLAYLWDTLNRSLFVLFIMFIFVQLWSAVYAEGGSPDRAIAGLTFVQVIWYLLIAETMELGKARHDLTISEEVKDGSIAYRLVRPYHYLVYHFFNNLGETVVRMGLVFFLGLPVVLYFAGPPQIGWRVIPPVLLIMAGGVLLDFCALSIIGLLAFVTEDIFSFRLIYQKLVFILGGLLFPLDFLPLWLQNIARRLPFQLTTYAPARLFVNFEGPLFLTFLGQQALWLTVFATVLWLQYRWAVKRLAINGG